MVDPVRAAFLSLVVLAIVGGAAVGRLEDAVREWRGLPLALRLLATVFFGWSFVAYVSPTLLALWEFVTGLVVGLGGEFLVTDLRTRLLLVLIAGLAVQTTVLYVKLDGLEERV